MYITYTYIYIYIYICTCVCHPNQQRTLSLASHRRRERIEFADISWVSKVCIDLRCRHDVRLPAQVLDGEAPPAAVGQRDLDRAA